MMSFPVRNQVLECNTVGNKFNLIWTVQINYNKTYLKISLPNSSWNSVVDWVSLSAHRISMIETMKNAVILIKIEIFPSKIRKLYDLYTNSD